MAERPPDEAYEVLLDILREHELSWVVVQIQDQVRTGKPTTRMVTPKSGLSSNDFADQATPTPSKRKERLAATEPYSPDERLALALDAIERAVIQTAEIEEEVLKFFRTEDGRPATVSFDPDEFEEGERVEIAPSSVPRRPSVENLRRLIEAVRSGRQ